MSIPAGKLDYNTAMKLAALKVPQVYENVEKVYRQEMIILEFANILFDMGCEERVVQAITDVVFAKTSQMHPGIPKGYKNA